MHESRILITCPKGIPPFLKNELLAGSFPILEEHRAGIETKGSLQEALLLNLLIRTGHRVLFLLKEFYAQSPDVLYQELSTFPWETIIPEDGYACITSSVNTASIKDSRFATLTCKDALVDRMRTVFGKRPDTGSSRDRTVIHLYWENDQCKLYFDTSGEPLSRRGYRKIPLKAPMQETLAAAVVQATSWNGDGNFINPMCGSGTLAIEAALVALNRAPGLLRNNFGFQHTKNFDKASWENMREDIKRRARKSFPGKIIATDIDPKAIEAARKNATTAGVENHIEFQTCNFSDTPIPEGGGVVVLNPEYGARMGEKTSLEKTYKDIGDYFKQKCLGYTGYVFTGNPRLSKKIGLKPSQTWTFFNSEIECKLLAYELYEGSRKNRNKN
ncbi:MAG: class I SAM-dependent RNA methyltransferase [Nitrospirota bacterium]